MSASSTIEWTDATWNPVRGCAIVSKGCTNCYAMKQAHRFSGPGRAYEGLTTLTKGGPVWTGKVTTHPELLDVPLRWKTPRRIFVNSMSDLFHEDVPMDFIAEVFARMAVAYRHTFQVLTKRAARMQTILSMPSFRERVAEYLLDIDRPLDYNGIWPLKRVWLGVSVEDQASADERIPLLLQTPAAVRWISAEPLLGPLNLNRAFYGADHGRGQLIEHSGRNAIDWVVAGGESGPSARPMHPYWVRSLREQCAVAGVPFFFKQWGSWDPVGPIYSDEDTPEHLTALEIVDDAPSECHLTPAGTRWIIDRDGQQPPGTWAMQRLDKRATGRELDGRTHDEYPA